MSKELIELANTLGVKMNEIHDLFTGHVEVTVVIRDPRKPDHSCDTYISNDDPELVKEVIEFFSNPESNFDETAADS